jgi:peptidoglycan/LPS O-acetylase OafA/YrhL
LVSWLKARSQQLGAFLVRERKTQLSQRPYIPGLDGIRAIAFLLVFWAHALPGISYYIPATLGVTIFFFLSGYLITTLLRRELAPPEPSPSATSTSAARCASSSRSTSSMPSAPPSPTSHCMSPWATGSGFFSLLFYYYNYTVVLDLKAWVPLGLNVIWSLCVEEHFYLLFPLVYLALARSRIARSTQTRLLIGFCLLELLWRSILIAVLHNQHLWTYYATDARLDSILWGSVLALTNNPVSESAPAKSRTAPSSLHTTRASPSSPLCSCWPPRCYPAASSTRSPCATPCKPSPSTSSSASSILTLAVLLGRWLEWKPLRYLGWISYVLYLSHDFILNVLETRRWPDRSGSPVPWAFVLSLAFATALRYTLELPLQRLRARFRRVPSDPTAADHHGLLNNLAEYL